LGYTDSGTISLFDEHRFPAHSPVTFLVSLLMHGVGFALLSIGLLYPPRLVDPNKARNWELRHIDLHTSDRQAGSEGKIRYPGKRQLAEAFCGKAQEAAHAPTLHLLRSAIEGKQTLVQPDLPAHTQLSAEVPVPAMVIWTPPKVHLKEIVAPQPAKLTSSDVRPSLVTPNQELTVAEVGIPSSALAVRPQPIPATTTTPIQMHSPDAAQLPPVTATQTAAQPTPAAVLSLSDLKMKEGRVNLPPVNLAGGSKGKEDPSLGQSKDESKPSGGKSDAPKIGNGAGQAAAKTPPGSAASSVAAGAAGGKDGAREGAGKGSGSASGSASGGDFNSDPRHTRIVRPIDGHFGAVIVGSSLEDQYPEIGDQWQGRLAYTVNLHVGTSKSWMLQYSVSRADLAAGAGAAARPEAPWPYSILRPNLAPGAINADALLVHGFISAGGRFENLAVAFPPDFRQAQFVLNSLSQWQFRPASQNGQPVRVEVLLIIPEVEE
jgi:hypothetical protein